VQAFCPRLEIPRPGRDERNGRVIIASLGLLTTGFTRNKGLRNEKTSYGIIYDAARDVSAGARERF
jgi:hypothetical protein